MQRFFAPSVLFWRLALDRRRSGAKVVHESATKGLNFCESCGIIRRCRMGDSAIERRRANAEECLRLEIDL